MLKQITIRDYAVVASLDMDLESGMTVITGETGAGKSIMLDALGLCIGDRADARTVRPGAKRADITAVFQIDELPAVGNWLHERELDLPTQECILRRVAGADGRSKAFINGAPATLVDCAAVGALLVDIHSQHAHQSLLRRASQRALLDATAGATGLAAEVAQASAQWHTLATELEQKTGQSAADTARFDLLTYQVSELDTLDLGAEELQSLEAQQKQLHNADFLIDSAGQAQEHCEQQLEQLVRTRQLVSDERHEGATMNNIREMLETAEIQLQEAQSELIRYTDQLDRDPGQLQWVTDRLEQVYDLARKHRVMPEELTQRHAQLKVELETLNAGPDQLNQLEKDLEIAQSTWSKTAKKLTAKRKKAAKQLIGHVSTTLTRLAMERCDFQVVLTQRSEDTPDPAGAEQVEFLISTNPGSAPGSLAKIASGGELSRISLALQVAAAESATAPTMIFDEVDVGIGGGVAEVVGELLNQLSQRVQVLCVTHLAQVACKGLNHLQVSKTGDAAAVFTEVNRLETEARVEEIARMQGGLTITESTRAHAREMLNLH
ncbi:DNA repair protein RecN [Luminiphilus sp. nBUS_16]|uniref:DNA repair protein RecN n=1 Tax=Luminiphilus sp. nBUS_16 TaxID=3395315 RepID=UPI003EBC7A78